jgi:hypothetical protein
MTAEDLRADDVAATGAHANKHVTPAMVLGFRLVNPTLPIEIPNAVKAVAAQYPSHLLWRQRMPAWALLIPAAMPDLNDWAFAAKVNSLARVCGENPAGAD